jgi:Concanavalin A-like lectin/glucanases superfamily
MIIQGVTLNGVGYVQDIPPFVTTNALLYLDAGLTSSYSGSGTTWTDLSTNTNNATITGSPTFTSAGTASYFSFNGAGTQYASTPTNKYNTTYTGKTVFVAARMNASFGTNQYRCLFGTPTGTRNFNTYIYSPSSGTYELHGSFGSGSIVSNALTLTTGQWFTMGITQDASGNMIGYFNGQSVYSATGQTLAQWSSNGGENVAYGDNYWYGDISVVSVYSRALSATEIAQNHAAVRSRYGI